MPKGSFNNQVTQNYKILTYLPIFVTLFYNKISFNAGNFPYLPWERYVIIEWHLIENELLLAEIHVSYMNYEPKNKMDSWSGA